MRKAFNLLILGILLVGNISLTGCASREETEEVTEKTPLNVIQLAPEAVRAAGIETVTV